MPEEALEALLWMSIRTRYHQELLRSSSKAELVLGQEDERRLVDAALRGSLQPCNSVRKVQTELACTHKISKARQYPTSTIHPALDQLSR